MFTVNGWEFKLTAAVHYVRAAKNDNPIKQQAIKNLLVN